MKEDWVNQELIHDENYQWHCRFIKKYLEPPTDMIVAITKIMVWVLALYYTLFAIATLAFMLLQYMEKCPI